jgi:hypothetical protein
MRSKIWFTTWTNFFKINFSSNIFFSFCSLAQIFTFFFLLTHYNSNKRDIAKRTSTETPTYYWIYQILLFHMHLYMLMSCILYFFWIYVNMYAHAWSCFKLSSF